ncbi:MAG: dehydratase [Candidatus Marinimicrobia bacterium]|jgi:acyl dehydratase|nr:dehydratase [Candidatus Neomarinimicrobiota bacterium]|tara:strand:- start:669 stop:1082 length:414 start_codon:yes stop_codon:yes gene_type:complete
MSFNLDNVTVGDKIPDLMIDPIKRSTLALYAGASGDHNPIHIDLDFAKKVGMGDVFAHGMLIMAYLGRALTNIIPQSNLKNLNTRFCSITNIGDELICSGQVSKVGNHNSKEIIVFDLMVADKTGDIKVTGTATIEK